MKITKKMSIGEFAALVASNLESKGISTALTGGAVVSIYTENKYMSLDADFISPTDHKTITKAMQDLGFTNHGKDFKHKDTAFFVEFPSGPLTIGDQPVKAEAELELNGHKLRLLSPTQSVMDRLSAYFYWNDLQCLDQATWVAEKHPLNISKIREWAKCEGEEDKFKIFLDNLKNKGISDI
jgi:hypothetical protein